MKYKRSKRKKCTNGIQMCGLSMIIIMILLSLLLLSFALLHVYSIWMLLQWLSMIVVVYWPGLKCSMRLFCRLVYAYYYLYYCFNCSIYFLCLSKNNDTSNICLFVWCISYGIFKHCSSSELVTIQFKFFLGCICVRSSFGIFFG